MGFGAYGIPAQFLPVTKLDGATTRYIAENLSSGSRYNVVLTALNEHGRSDPVLLTIETLEPEGRVADTLEVTLKDTPNLPK